MQSETMADARVVLRMLREYETEEARCEDAVRRGEVKEAMKRVGRAECVMSRLPDAVGGVVAALASR